jgi:hypothetical protein
MIILHDLVGQERHAVSRRSGLNPRDLVDVDLLDQRPREWKRADSNALLMSSNVQLGVLSRVVDDRGQLAGQYEGGRPAERVGDRDQVRLGFMRQGESGRRLEQIEDCLDVGRLAGHEQPPLDARNSTGRSRPLERDRPSCSAIRGQATRQGRRYGLGHPFGLPLGRVLRVANPEGRRRRARLLYDVGQLVREQAAAFGGGRAVRARGEVDIRAEGEGFGSQGATQRSGPGIGV